MPYISSLEQPLMPLLQRGCSDTILKKEFFLWLRFTLR